MSRGQEFQFTNSLEQLQNSLEVLATAENPDDKSTILRDALRCIADLGSTSADMDLRLELLRKQSNSLRLTGFVDWIAIDKEFDKSNKSHEVANTSSKKIIKKINNAKFPSYVYPEANGPKTKIRVASILDKFSESAFSYEWNNVPLSKDNWQEELIGCDLLFVESAWAGNTGDWQYCLTGQSAPRKQVIELLVAAREQGIPSVFWNKEDPPHFADFLRTAALFDVVLTTDAECVEKYKQELGHSRIGVLPFAAQPMIHNPIRPAGIHRDREVAFGGMYFAHKFPERREQMDYLLPAASKFGFDIFSRQLGGDPNYQFPPPFDENVVGSLSYEQMLTAYHAYAVFLNVNSVTSSSTMCARRVFEILASGGAVVSAPSPAIEAFFPDGLVPMPRTEAESFHAIRALLQPGGFRDKQIHKAQRLIWENHTFEHRVAEIFRWTGLKSNVKKPVVSVIAPTIRPEYVQHILKSVARQRNVDLELNLLLHGFELNEKEIRAEAKDLGIESFNLLTADPSSSLGSNLNRLVLTSSGDIVSKMDDDDFYGEDYLSDLLNAKMFSSADVVGKATAYIHFESKNATILSYGASENRFGDFVRGATLTADRALFLDVPFQNLNRSEDSTFLKSVRSDGGRIYGSDRFNFWIRRSAQSGHHTWSVNDSELFATGPVVSYGDPTEFVGA